MNMRNINVITARSVPDKSVSDDFMHAVLSNCTTRIVLPAPKEFSSESLPHNFNMAAAFNMKQTVDAFFDSASQKQLSEAQSKALSARFNTALEASLQAWQQKHHAVILVSPAVVQGAPDITREIQQDIARRMRAEP